MPNILKGILRDYINEQKFTSPTEVLTLIKIINYNNLL